MKTIDLYKSGVPLDRISEHISYFFNTFIRYTKDIYFQKVDIIPNVVTYVSIMKDDLRRLDRKKGGSGVLKQREYSIYVFSFIDMEKYKSIFGTTSIYKEPTNITEDSSEFELGETQIKNSKYENRIYRSRKINVLLQDFIYKSIVNERNSLLANSYLYSVNIFDNESKDLKNNFSVYYLNTAYKFDYISANAINTQKSDINVTSSLLNNISENLDIIEKRNDEILNLVKAYTGDLALTNITEKNYEDVYNSINAGEEYIIVSGMARTGKTVIAMRLLHDFQEANLLLMNYLFYCDLKRAFDYLKVPFPEGRIYHHNINKGTYATSWNFGKRTNNKFLIVDEAQRLGVINELCVRNTIYPAFDEIDKVIGVKDHKHTIFLGDDLQAINPKYDKGLERIKEKIKEKGGDYIEYYFEHSIGLPSNILQGIKFLVNGNISSTATSFNQYKVKIFNDESKFIKCYKNDHTIKKHMATIGLNGYSGYTITGFENHAPSDYYNYKTYFLDEEVKTTYMLTPYQLISRELDEIYIYLPNHISASNNGLEFINPSLNSFVINQIYVLMTRGRTGINIYCEDNKAYDYLSSRLKIIDSNPEYDDASYLLTDVESYKRENIKGIIEERGITRLVHFTPVENLDSIMVNGLIPRKCLENKKIKYVYNDKMRLDDQKFGPVCLSVQNPNLYLLRRFKEGNKNRKYVALILDPAILYDITTENGMALAKRTYCNYNAAASTTVKDENNIEIMFANTVTGNSYSRGPWATSRNDKEPNETTCEQAEILFFERIDPRFIIDIKEI